MLRLLETQICKSSTFNCTESSKGPLLSSWAKHRSGETQKRNPAKSCMFRRGPVAMELLNPKAALPQLG